MQAAKLESGRRRSILAAGLVAAVTVAHAKDFDALTLPTQAPIEVAATLAGARLHGAGVKRFLGFAIYDARLWASSEPVTERFEAYRFALELQYARNFEGAAIAQRSIEEMRRAGPIDDSQAAAWVAAMRRAFPDVAPGDRLTGLHLPGEASRFFHNGRPTSAVADAAFARRFFGIWLADSSSDPPLRRQLLGLGS
jgi:hypothetical protein